jgi:hypothetical protein
MRDDFDPRPWNLFVGAALLAGCSERSLNGVGGEGSETTAQGTESDSSDTDDVETSSAGDTETGDTETGDTETGDTETGDTETGDTETGDTTEGYYGACVTDEDCADYGWMYDAPYVCSGGYCFPAWECLYEGHCELFETCEEWACVSQGTPPPACDIDEFAIPTILDPGETPLALSFADLDDDGRDELVVATEIDLEVYEFGMDVPTVSPREVSSAAETNMTAGHFDDQPGEDIILVVDGDYHRYFSDGNSSLEALLVEPSPLFDAPNLSTGDFDGQAPSDLVVWGPGGALLDLGDPTVALTGEPVRVAAAFDYGSPGAGVAIVTLSNEAVLFDLMGGVHQSIDYVHMVWKLAAPNEPRYLTGIAHDEGWSEFHVRSATDLGLETTLLVAARIVGVTGDFDGDQHDDFFAESDISGSAVVFGLFTEPCVAAQEIGSPVDLFAVGDHDGDGDDEVATLTWDEKVRIFDLE